MAENSWRSSLKDVGKFLAAEVLWPPFKRHADYWWSLGDNIQELEYEILFLERKKRDMDQKVEEARLRGERVNYWSNEVTLKLEEARRILQEHHDLNVGSIISRYSVGKKAKRTAEALEKLRKDGNSISIAYPALPSSMVSSYDEPFMEFQSRSHVEEEIMASLSDDHVHMIAICGLGGAGKTTMAQRIVNRVRRENSFDEVVMVVVSQQIEMSKVQKEIAELLGLNFSEDTLVGRAHKLRNRLLDSKRKLIIFDDVWESFKLGAIGVPSGERFTMGKIILTSRVKDACLRMNAQKIIELEILTDEEAWTLFKQKAGSYVEGSGLLPIAKQIVKECKGLPVCLVTVGKALKDQSIHVWRDSLSQLRSSIPTDFPEVIKEVYKPLKLSYDILEINSTKSLFLLCCSFPEDSDIDIERLIWYSIGLGILEGIKNIEEGRNRIYSFVEKLKSRYLLISGGQRHHVKMHDVIRDVGIFICSKENHGWLKRIEASSMGSSSQDSLHKCSWMLIDISTENVKLPVWSDFPNLRLLMIRDSSQSFSRSKFYERVDADFICFRRIEELNVLYFSGLKYASFPQSLNLLEKLRTLHLVGCQVEDISLVGELSSLEILIVHYCYKIKELPVHVGRLNHLRVLELVRCRCLERISSGVISRLVGLEELKIIDCFDKWEPKENQSEERNASLSELESLQSLTCLEIQMSNHNLVAEEIRLSQHLVRYKINSREYAWRHLDKMRSIALTLQGDVKVGNWIRQLLRSTQSLVLRGAGPTMMTVVNSSYPKFLVRSTQPLLLCGHYSTMKTVVNSGDPKFLELEEMTDVTIPEEESNSFQKLESVKLCHLPRLVHLGNSLNQNASGGNLKSIYIESCPNLRYVLSTATARSLVQLECLQILCCDTIEQVSWNEIESNRDASIIELPALKELILRSLPNLTNFSHGVEIIECPQLTKLEIKDCPKLKTKIGKCPNLRDIRLHTFSGVDHLLSSCVTRKWNTQLQAIKIGDCDTIEEIFWDEVNDAGNRHIIFPELKKLKLRKLPCLTTFYRGVEGIKFPKLTKLRIRNLEKMNSLAPTDWESTHDNHSLHFFCNQKVEFPSLRRLYLQDLNDIISNIWCRNIPINFFRNLCLLRICSVNGIRNLMSSSIAKNLVNLSDLTIVSCPNIVEVIEDEKEVPDAPLFPELRRITFTCLHKLRSFYPWKHALELPLLDRVYINDCPRMETFTLGSLSTPKLTDFRISGKKVEIKDLNAGIHNFMAKMRTRKRKRT